MIALRTAMAALLFLAVAALSMARAQDTLQGPLRDLEPWLGEWTAARDDDAADRVEYRAALGGRFVEAWHRDARTGELLAHSMIAAGEGDAALIEYRFDSQGRLSLRPFDTGNGFRATPLVDSREEPVGIKLDPSLATLEPFLGQWEVTTDWLDGGVMWAQMTNRAELGGRVFGTRVLAAENGEPSYDRFRIFYYRDESGDLRELTFTYSGKVVNEKLFTFPVEQNVSLLTLYEPGTMASIGIRKRLTVTSDRRMHWTDDFRAEDDTGWERVVDAEWVRVSPADPTRRTMPVDDTLFAAVGAGIRSIDIERIIDAVPDLVWDAWTTEDGWRAAYAPDRPEVRANIELAPGGTYEWLFDGVLGCNGCQVLSYVPQRMLSFTWNSPVTQPGTRLKHTWVVVEIEAADHGRTLVRLTQVGFGEGSDWDETYEYFGNAWAYVLEQMAKNLELQALDARG